MNADHKIPLMEQEMAALDGNEQKLSNPHDSLVKGSINQTKLSIKNAFSRISHLSVHNVNTALFFIRENWKSGMTQAMMNMPFILNAGNNTGGNPSAAYTSALIGGLINGFFSGSNHSIYAPTWVAAGFNYQIVQKYGYEAVPWVTIMIGLQIYILSHMKWHHLIDFMPNYVIEGYYLGLLFLIANGYIDYAFGLSDMHSNRGFQVYHDRFEMYQEFFRRGDLYYFGASIFIFLLLYFGWKINKDLPLIVLVCLTGLMVGILFPTEKCLKNVYGDVSLRLSFIESGGPHFQPDMWTLIFLFVYAIKMTFYITIQNLLCAKGAEYFTGVKCDHDKEILCVSLTNICAGIFNSIPCCASIRLIILNIRVRNMNRWSSILNGLSVILFYGLFSRYFLQIPLYFVSGILLYSAYMCPTWPYLEMLWRTKRRLILVKQITISIICVYYGAIESTMIGSMYAMLQFAEKMSAAASEVIVSSDEVQKNSLIKRSCVRQQDGTDMQLRDDTLGVEDDFPDTNQFRGSFAIYRFNGAINYINVKNHIAQIKQLPERDYIVLSFRYVSVFDDEAIDKLSLMIQALISSQREVLLTGLNEGMIDEMRYNEYMNNFYKKHRQHFKLLGQ
ncbi:unnamed protein product [Paramecium octaurelia]|uniref:SLC26A/SulP transporter domain-containing protein n=1 Tax=Paramecium octaurelia TaxID=43137 RepID=A0A8S1YAD0_PAROT|nr:unnamed protein product [Paramecium octaurelia]